jgi:PhnB protein
MAPQAKPIPDGYHSVTPHLIVRGGTKAIDFYKKAFGAQELHRMLMPDGKLMHGALKVGDSIVMLGEECPEMGGQSPLALKATPVTIHLYVTDADAAFKRAVDAGATVKMPILDMFWGDRYGQVTDPFGHVWSIATHKRDLSPQEVQKAGAEAMAKMGPPVGAHRK